jgi:hypothetical protein
MGKSPLGGSGAGVGAANFGLGLAALGVREDRLDAMDRFVGEWAYASTSKPQVSAPSRTSSLFLKHSFKIAIAS